MVAVLVVDDEVNVRTSLAYILEDAGYEVVAAKDGLEALNMAAERHYGFIIIDVRMPGMDGVATLEEIKKIDPLVKVILLSGYDLLETAKKMVEVGGYTLVTKPVDPEYLLGLINSSSGETQDRSVVG